MPDARSSSLVSVLKSGRVREFAKKELVQSTEFDKCMCLVKSGYVKRYLITNEGSTSIQSIYGPGSFFPFSLVYEIVYNYSVYEGPETFYYEAMCDTVIYVLEASDLRNALKKNPLLYKDLLFVAGRRFKWSVHRHENASLHDAYRRVAHLLLFLAKNAGKTDSHGTKIDIPLTQQDLADCLSTTRETASLALSRLRKKRLISASSDILIPNLDKLEKEAYS